MEEDLKQAYLYGAQMGAEYMRSIEETDLSVLTPDQALTFSECVCKNYHNKLIEINSQNNN